VQYQQWLRRRNRNAAELEGETASPQPIFAKIGKKVTRENAKKAPDLSVQPPSGTPSISATSTGSQETSESAFGFGFGVIYDAAAETGLVYVGAAAQGSVGIGGFWDFSKEWSRVGSAGAFASGGLMARVGKDEAGLPSRESRDTLRTALGAYIGVGGGVFFTTAKNASELAGPAEVVSINTPAGSLQFTLTAPFFMSATLGPGAWFSISEYTVWTFAASSHNLRR
jgi:hypothetical protein